MSELGKKVFFLYPPSVIKDELIVRLIEQEYEVYLLKDHAPALGLLKKYPDSIVYINLDAGLAEREWAQWIRGIMNNPDLKTVGIGIVSYNTDEKLQKKYLMDIGIGYGFIKLKLGLEESTKILLSTLKASEAKGRRKFVRASCRNDGLATVNIKEGQSLVSGQIYDISAVGFSCFLTTDPSYRKNAIVRDIQLKLRASLISTEAIVFGTRTEEDGKLIYVFLFTRNLDNIAREKIRTYIQTSLQNEIEAEALEAAKGPEAAKA
jgi:hypothetical protein